jgi:hypothetical protein
MRKSFWSRNGAVVQSKPNDVNLLSPDLWDEVSDNAQSEILRQAEMMVKGTITVALGADLRAATTMNVFGAGGVALLAAAATLIGGSKPDWLLICAPSVGATGLLIAAALCAYAIAPVSFYLSGARPQSVFYRQRHRQPRNYIESTPNRPSAPRGRSKWSALRS